ncbi:H-type small acid-soluble spore protein [Bacillus sp. H-16]|uniref:H-type small acid-soluble spore protein n=1 Tax=Alteribacter salitolerans TaxID=2912333 RepID=UPI001966A320|nr:H-type small acid-soluble spore protein [Alteribacter salitolerans]MBM7094521.1 H-type small acid-soluble spore protein [Alteribacter salitolerans]
MDAMRAQEIVDSAKEHNVFFNGTRVWIQHVDSEMDTARVFPAKDPEDEMTVPLDQLQEQH